MCRLCVEDFGRASHRDRGKNGGTISMTSGVNFLADKTESASSCFSSTVVPAAALSRWESSFSLFTFSIPSAVKPAENKSLKISSRQYRHDTSIVTLSITLNAYVAYVECS